MAKKIGDWVTAHLAVGDAPAIVTRFNQDESVSLTIFSVGTIIHRDNVKEYVFEAGDEPEDKVGFYSNG